MEEGTMKKETSKLLRSALLVVLFMSIITLSVRNGISSEIVPIDAVHSGWYSSHGLHDPWNSNTLTGGIPDYYWGGVPYFSAFNSFFVFDLSDLSGVVTGGVLRLELAAYNSPEETKSFTVSDVSTSIADLLSPWEVWGSAGGKAVYSDLGSGVVYGVAEVSPDGVGKVLEINLSSLALQDLNDSKGALFAIGISLDHIASIEGGEWIRFLEKEEMGTPQLILTTQKPDIAVTPESIDFGNVPIGSLLDQDMTIRNNGEAHLRIGTIPAPDVPFIKLSDLCSNQVLAPGADCAIIYRFAPTGAGSFTSTTEIPSDDPDAPGVLVQLNGVSGPHLTAEWAYIDKLCKEGKGTVKCKIKGALAIRNIGTLASSSAAVKFYLSSDNAYDFGDGPALKAVATGKIKAGQIKAKKISYSFPNGETLSGKYIIAVIEATDAAIGADDADNRIPCAIP
jgi:hypothetical protein